MRVSTLKEKQSAIRRLLALEAGDVIINSDEYTYSGEPLIEVVGNEDPKGNIAIFDLRDDFELRRSELVEAMELYLHISKSEPVGDERMEEVSNRTFQIAIDFVKKWEPKK